MAGERKIENSEPNVQVLKPDISALKSDKDMASRKDDITSEPNCLPPGGDGVPAPKGDTDKKADAQQGVYQPPNGGYNYYYHGYNGGYNQLDEQSYLASMGGSYGGMPDSPYYVPGYNPYNPGYMGTDAENAYLSPGYYQQLVSYGSEALQSPQWNSTYAGDKNHKPVNKTDDVKSSFGRKDSVSAGNTNLSKTMHAASTVPLNSKARKFTVSSEFAKSLAQSKPLKPLNRLGSGFPSIENINAYYPSGKFSGFNNANQGVYNYMHYGPQMNYHGNGGRVWSNNQRFKSRNNFRRDGENEGLNELTRGPRATNIKYDQAKVSSDDGQPALTVQKEKYNSEEFQTVYESAKFFVIKSYSEDDIHKCVKYDVWSSTPNGNKKLDAAYREAETKASESGTKCPIFLFFSVNGSGQFLGVAEMTGQVDFNKTMDFWQLDKWSGFFPVKWHIVKDLPNNLLRQITLENNENKPVTFSRDSQEVGLKQGLEILDIFKKYLARTSLLDDFVFYENREKALKAKRGSKPALVNDVFKKEAISGPNAGDGLNEVDSKIINPDVIPSLVNLTKDLSLSSVPVEGAV